MILVIDSGNSNIVIALYQRTVNSYQQKTLWRLQNLPMRTADEYAAILLQLLAQENISFADIKAMIISSVVPMVETGLARLAQQYVAHADLAIIGQQGFMPQMNILLDQPSQLGADRLINAWQAFKQYQQPMIVIDFGTATTFDVVDAQGQYCGGIIAAGIQLSMEALAKRAAKLSMSDFKKPEQLIGRNTNMAMQSGFFYGTIGMVESLITRLKAQVPASDDQYKVIATGGFAELINNETDMIDDVQHHLILDGLIALYDEKFTD